MPATSSGERRLWSHSGQRSRVEPVVSYRSRTRLHPAAAPILVQTLPLARFHDSSLQIIRWPAARDDRACRGIPRPARPLPVLSLKSSGNRPADPNYDGGSGEAQSNDGKVSAAAWRREGGASALAAMPSRFGRSTCRTRGRDQEKGSSVFRPSSRMAFEQTACARRPRARSVPFRRGVANRASGHTPHRKAAVWTGASHRRVVSAVSRVTVSEQPAISSEVT